MNEIEPLKLWSGVNVSVPSGFSETVPCGSVTGLPALIAWPATATMVRPADGVSLLRGSNTTGRFAAVVSVSGLATGATASGAAGACSAGGVAAATGLTFSEAGVTDSESRPTRRPSSRLPGAPPLLGPAAGTTSASPWPTCVIRRSTSSPAVAPASCVCAASIWMMPSCAVRTTSPFFTTSPTCSGTTSPSSRRMCASPQTPTTLPTSWRTGT